MRIFIFSLIAVFIFSCNKEPANDQITSNPGNGSDTTNHDSIPIKTHVLVLGLTNDSLVVWQADSMRFLHNHYNVQSRSRGGQMILSDSTLYIAGGNEDNKAVYYKNFVKTTLSPYYSHASTIYATNGHVYVGGFMMDRGDGHNMAETYATDWEDGKRHSFLWGGSQFNFIYHQDTITTSLGFERGDGSYSYGPGIYLKNNERQALSTFNAETKGVAVKDTVTYIVGNIYFNGWQPKATLWKNGKETYIYGLQGQSQATAIFIQGKDVYISGMIEQNAVYWKNGVAVPLSDNASARDIKVVGNDVYIVGQAYGLGGGWPVAVLWKNGVQKRLSSSNQLSDAFSVVIL